VADHKIEFDRRGVSVVVVSFAEPAKLVHYQERHRWSFPILADPERRAYRAFALPRLTLWRVFSPSTLKLYWRLMRRGMKQERYGGADIYQSGGDFLLDRDGNVLFAYRGKDPADRPPVSALLQEIDQPRFEPHVSRKP
jgi:peroxiredoxin